VSRIRGRRAGGGGLVLHFHGGGYVAGSARTHRAMLARLSDGGGVPVDAPGLQARRGGCGAGRLRGCRRGLGGADLGGWAPGRIVLGGDSAGGGVALALLSHLCLRGRPPAGLYAFSPWTDLSLSGGSIRSNAEADPLLPAWRLGDLARIVLGGLSPQDPRISPLFARFPGPPPVLLQAGRTEILLDDTLRMAGRLEADGAEVTVELWPDTPHVVQFFGDWLPEAREARARAAAFVRRCLQTSAPASR
jgi:epsilon-lactone hydrolase